MAEHPADLHQVQAQKKVFPAQYQPIRAQLQDTHIPDQVHG
jgi:hypothetical protein